jgi:hypothetical protein
MADACVDGYPVEPAFEGFGGPKLADLRKKANEDLLEQIFRRRVVPAETIRQIK